MRKGDGKGVIDCERVGCLRKRKLVKGYTDYHRHATQRQEENNLRGIIRIQQNLRKQQHQMGEKAMARPKWGVIEEV